MTQPQPLDLDAIEQRIPHYDGPWTFELDDDGRHWVVLYPSDSPIAGLIATVPDYGYELAEFIGHAREDVPAMAAEIRRLRAEVDAVDKLRLMALDKNEKLRAELEQLNLVAGRAANLITAGDRAEARSILHRHAIAANQRARTTT